jgi:Holliday junction DNA helicase RuvB
MEPRLRPKGLESFIGQEEIRRTLQVVVSAAKFRGEAADHVLLHGPPGLGKTTLAYIMANEMGSKAIVTTGPLLTSVSELVSLVAGVEERDVFFIDEIHRMSRTVEEVLYSAVEDFRLDLVIGQGAGTCTVTLELPKFTLVGATTKTSMLTPPMLMRFNVVLRMEFYLVENLTLIAHRTAKVLGIEVDDMAALTVALRSRGTPRVVNQLMRWLRNYANSLGVNKVDQPMADKALSMLGIDRNGLNRMDRKILKLIVETYGGGPVGIDTIAAALSEDSNTIEDVHEPFLIQSGFLKRTSKGRMATESAFAFVSEGVKNP